MTDLLITDKTRDLNPWNLKEGDSCFQILIDCDTALTSGPVKYSGKVSVPASQARDVEEAATVAFLIAREDGLKSPLMSYCAFYFYEDTPGDEGWVHFL